MTPPRTPVRASGRRVLEALRDRGPLSRSRIAELASLPRPTVVSAVAALEAAGLVTTDQQEQEPRRGRPSSTIDLAWAPTSTLVVDWQRATLEAVRLGPGTADSSSTPLPREALETAETLAAALGAAWSRLAPDGTALARVVVSAPAPVDAGVRALISPGPLLTGQHVDRPRRLIPDWLMSDPGGALGTILGCGVVVENDANLAALGETESAPADTTGRNALVVSITDGLGAGLVLDGRLHRGSDGLAGELAHLQVNPSGRICVCGSRGCLITELSDGPLFASEISAAYGHEVTLADVMRLVAAGDPGVIRVVSDVGSLIGGQIASAVAWLNLDTVVVDGSLGPAAEVVVEAVRTEILARVTPRSSRSVQVRTGRPDGSARLLGARRLTRSMFVDDVFAADI